MSSHSGASETSVFKLSGNAESESGMSFKEDTEPEAGTGAAGVPPHLRHTTAALFYGETYGKAPRLSAEQRSPSPMGNATRFAALTKRTALAEIERLRPSWQTKELITFNRAYTNLQECYCKWDSE